MNYEKAYKDALERARNIHNEHRAQCADVMVKVFPELRESEDERIRKEIISFLKEEEPYYCPNSVRRQEWANWLEKQGELKLLNNEEYQTLPVETLDRLYAAEKELEQLKQDKQKSSWSEEDELMIQDAIHWINEFQKSNRCKDENDMQNSVTCENWLKSIKDRVRPQSHQEWSEDDERNASYICAALDCYYRLREDRNNTNGQEDLDKARNWLYNKLKSLRPQSK